MAVVAMPTIFRGLIGLKAKPIPISVSTIAPLYSSATFLKLRYGICQLGDFLAPLLYLFLRGKALSDKKPTYAENKQLNGGKTSKQFPAEM